MPDLRLPWRDALPLITPPSLSVVRRVADRRWCLALGERLGAALPGARIATSLADLEPRASSDDAWIAKAPITAGGRDRVRRRGAPDDATRTRLARLLERTGALVIEPWATRLVDVGQPGVVLGRGAAVLLPAHVLHVDASGGFAGIGIPADRSAAALGLGDDEHERLRLIASFAADALGDEGYRGPFTIDAFAWRDAGGVRRFHPLCELNPRLTFGFVARAWAERLGAPLTLRVAEAAPPEGAIVLLRPGADDPTAAWLER